MRRDAAGAFAALALLAAGACGGGAAIRDDEPAHLVEDLARALRPEARAWLRRQQSREEDETLAHPSSAEISTLRIDFERLIGQARKELAPYLPVDALGVPVPSGMAGRFRLLAESLGAVEEAGIAAAEESREGDRALVRLTIAPPDRPASAWLLSLRRFEGAWRFTDAPRRG